MKSDYKLQFRFFFKLLWVCVFALLYSFGGIEFKWIRRFLAPVWLTLGMFTFSGNWKVIFYLPLQIAALHLGYGAEIVWQKVLKRLLYAFANAQASIVLIFSSDKRFIFSFLLHNILCISAIVILGVFNPLNARGEELAIGFIIGFMPMFMPKEKDV
ncbi:MAG: hypothetical protein WCI77_08095 [Candidatus Omnitrophota bacterium]